MASKIEILAKITKPRMELSLNRERLFELLDKYRERPVIWVVGPAGSGKTSLVSSYIEQRKIPYLWYKVDETDADAANVFYHLRLGAKAASPRKKIGLPLFTPEYVLGLPAFTKRFYENLFDKIGKPSMFVMDNYQNSAEGALPEILRHSISVVPGGVTLVVVSRTKPPSFMARNIANQKMRIVGWEDLKLSFEETTLLVKRVYQKNLSDSVVRQLYEKIDGWIAGLILLLSQTDIEKLPLQILHGETPEIIFDYFANEVFEKVPAETQNFLMATSMLSRITVKIARDLTGHSDSENILEKLYSDNFFTFKHRGNPAFYNYHALFRDFLIARANKRLPAEAHTKLKSKAAILLESIGAIEDAAALYRQTGDDDKLINLILCNTPILLEQGRHNTVRTWITNLPDQAVDSNSWLLYWLGSSILPFKPSQSLPIFESALEQFEAHQDPQGIFLALSGVFQSIAYSFDKFDLFDQWIPEVEKYREIYPVFPSQQVEALITSNMLYAFMLRQSNHPDFLKWENRGLKLIENNLAFQLKLQLLLPVLMNRIFSGKLSDARNIIEILDGLISSTNVPPLVEITMGNAKAIFNWLNADFNACKKSINKAIDLALAHGIHTMSLFLNGHNAARLLSCGELSKADKILNSIKADISQTGAWNKGYYYYLRLWRALIGGDVDDAEIQSRLALTHGEIAGMPQTKAIVCLGRAIVLQLAGKEQPAVKLLADALDLCEKYDMRQVKFSCLLTEARFAFNRDDQSAGLKALRRAFSVSSRNSYYNTYFWRQDEMADLCGRALEAAICENHVRKIILKRRLNPRNGHIYLANWPWPIRIFTLGRFEIQTNGKPLHFKSKAPKKPLSLLKTLAAHGGRDVSNALILDALWPDLDGDAAHSAFTSCLHRLRKLLDNERAIRVQEGKISFNSKICWLDLWSYEKSISQAESLWMDVAGKNRNLEAVKLTEKIMAQYNGVFLPDDFSARVIARREILTHRFLGCLRPLIQNYEDDQKWDKAVLAYNRGIGVDPLAEDFYRGLMSCYKRLDRQSEIISTYRFCQTNLSTYAGIKPSQETVDLYLSLI